MVDLLGQEITVTLTKQSQDTSYGFSLRRAASKKYLDFLCPLNPYLCHFRRWSYLWNNARFPNFAPIDPHKKRRARLSGIVTWQRPCTEGLHSVFDAENILRTFFFSHRSMAMMWGQQHTKNACNCCNVLEVKWPSQWLVSRERSPIPIWQVSDGYIKTYDH